MFPILLLQTASCSVNLVRKDELVAVLTTVVLPTTNSVPAGSDRD